MNNNQKLIDGLRLAADWLESKPDFPDICRPYGFEHPQTLRMWAESKLQLNEAARHLGSFEKEFTDHYLHLRKNFNEALRLEVTIDREQVCKKIVTWDCPDDDALLKLVETVEVE